jgi:glyoxylase-like metal-dependent hydrolase (beta-lactamase superfamily II)/8-oxo-dGTP pyrophosphatase MutT (NUDIX family)
VSPLVPRPAATLILLRQGPEVLMLQRAQTAAFLGGAYVFPGGALDPEDHFADRVLGLTEAQANERLKLSSGGIAYYVAAIRECFEEAGILLARDATGAPISPERAEKLLHWRKKPFRNMLEAEDLYLPAGELAYYGHWITAPGRSRRFDARFFVALAPEGQQGSHDAGETVHDIWITPREALERGARGEIELVHATQFSLKDLARFSDARAAFDQARALPEIEENRACWAQGREGPKIFRRGDPPYFEIHWSDPDETGETTYDIVPGEPKRLDRSVTRITAPNPGMMTGPGTNSYIVGAAAVIDPGPAVDSHIEKLAQIRGLKFILCTHTHLDHSPAAALLKAKTGARVLGRPAPAEQDATFRPDVVVEHGQRIQLEGMSGSITLRAIHTPGHASNHVCYMLEQTKMLFTGDHVMQGSTVVINPPDGNMRAYLQSLEQLLGEDIAIIAPGHGHLIGAPHKELRRLIAHRLNRERKVLAALERLGHPSLEEMLPLVYDDVPQRVHRVAARSLTAHLEKLVADGAVRSRNGGYSLVK